jgi:Cys-rich four helix bundle protein (predicted Tat secretion target)
MKRRDFIASAMLAAPALALTQLAAAADAPGGDLDAVVAASEHCLKTGMACLRHCQKMLGGGDTTMKDCEATVENMMASCEAMVKIGGYRSASEKDLKAMARACAAFCRSCEAECRKHAKKHQVCADCLDSCTACAKACEAYAA